jgi:hypothetical protein
MHTVCIPSFWLSLIIGRLKRGYQDQFVSIVGEIYHCGIQQRVKLFVKVGRS